MFKNRILLFHLLTALVVVIWGTTFVSTKVLLQNGLGPIEIMFYRFLLAYLGILLISHKRWWAENWKDEGMLMLSGLTGGTFYFIAENTALGITQASNVALLVCTTPIFTALLANWFFKEPLRKNMLLGSLIALVGVGMVVFSGSVLLQINPLGDFLSIVAALMWAIYCLILKPLGKRYSTAFITRKVFFYGVLTILPYYLVVPGFPTFDVLCQPQVLTNLLFLGCIASMVCFLVWNWCISRLGAVEATNWVYLNPLATIVAASIVLDEKITPYFLIGSALILLGLYLTDAFTGDVEFFPDFFQRSRLSVVDAVTQT